MRPGSMWIPLAALLALGLSLPFPVQGQDAVEYRLVITCPVPQYIQISTSSQGGCPVRAVDSEDMMGDPSLAVDPLEPNNLIMASLHGGVYRGDSSATGGSISVGAATSCAEPGPTPKSRCGQIFTTFTSRDSGASWTDNPYFPPDEFGWDTFGEHPQVTIDPYGHVYVGSLYAIPVPDGFRYVIGSQKFSSMQTIDEEQFQSSGTYNVEFIDPVNPAGAIRQMWFLFNPRTDNMTMVWYETSGGAVDETLPPPDACLLPLPLPDPCILPLSQRPRVGAASAQEPGPNATVPYSGVIGVTWTSLEENASYNRQKAEWAIGPCKRSTNPVLSDGYLYVGCVADPSQGPFRWNPDAVNGSIELFRMDPDGGRPEYMGSSNLIGGAPKLGVRSDGRLSLVSAQATPDGLLDLAVVFGSYDPQQGRIAWTAAKSLGQDITPPNPGLRVVRANVQDLIYREQSGVIHLILRETIEPAGIGATAAQAVLGPHIQKSIVAVDERHGLLIKFPLDIGNLLNRTDPVLLNQPEIAYEDLSDDFLQLPPGPFEFRNENLGDAYQREFFAVGDYGTVIFAEVVEITELRAPGVPPPPVPVAAIPAASSSVTQALVPAAGGVVALLAISSFIASRRKDPMAALTKGGKK